jgi:hypothetical protein
MAKRLHVQRPHQHRHGHQRRGDPQRIGLGHGSGECSVRLPGRGRCFGGFHMGRCRAWVAHTGRQLDAELRSEHAQHQRGQPGQHELLEFELWHDDGYGGYEPERRGSFNEYYLGLDFPGGAWPGTTFNTGMNPNYGQIASPGVAVSVTSKTVVPNYGTVVPSNPEKDYTQPTWVTATVWTCRGVAAVSFITAGALIAAGYPIFGAAAASGAVTTTGSLAAEAVATAEAQAVGSAFGVIGSYPGYIAVAEQLGAVYFNLSATLYEAAGVVANQAFIRAAIGLGVTFILSSDPEYAGEGLQMEIDMLKAAGYIFTQTGWGTTLTPPGAP